MTRCLLQLLVYSIVIVVVAAAEEKNNLPDATIDGIDKVKTWAKQRIQTGEKLFDHSGLSRQLSPDHWETKVVYQIMVDRFNNGAILDDGSVVCKDLSELTSGSQPKAFYYWNPSTIVNNETMSVTEASVDFTNASAVKAFAGSLFTLKETEAANQCYKVESITFGEDGLVELTGSYAKLSTDAGNEGKLEMLQNWSSITNDGNSIFDYEEV